MDIRQAITWARAVGLDIDVIQYDNHYRLLLWQGPLLKVADSRVSTVADTLDLLEKWRSENFENVSRCGRVEFEC